MSSMPSTDPVVQAPENVAPEIGSSADEPVSAAAAAAAEGHDVNATEPQPKQGVKNTASNTRARSRGAM